MKTNIIFLFQYFHPAFRGHHNPNGMEVEQITSLVSIFSFGQQLFNSGCMDRPPHQVYTPPSPESTATTTITKLKKTATKNGGRNDDDESGDESDSDTSSDSGHSSDDQNNADDITKPEDLPTPTSSDNTIPILTTTSKGVDQVLTSCAAEQIASDNNLCLTVESGGSVAAAVATAVWAKVRRWFLLHKFCDILPWWVESVVLA